MVTGGTGPSRHKDGGGSVSILGRGGVKGERSRDRRKRAGTEDMGYTVAY